MDPFKIPYNGVVSLSFRVSLQTQQAFGFIHEFIRNTDLSKLIFNFLDIDWFYICRTQLDRVQTLYHRFWITQHTTQIFDCLLIHVKDTDELMFVGDCLSIRYCVYTASSSFSGCIE
jgi:hypothetical protein